MSATSIAPAKQRDSTSSTSDSKFALLDPRRLSELIGFLMSVAGLLLLLSLASYRPIDPSLHTSTADPTVRNWIGLVGSYSADLLFQVLGWVAFLLPTTLFVVGARKLFDKPFAAPWTKAVGAVMLGASLAALLEIFPYTPRVGGLVHGGGLTGILCRTVGVPHLSKN